MGNEWGDGYTAGQAGFAIALKSAATLERLRIIQELLNQNVIRTDALGQTVFINCNTLEVEYLSKSVTQGEE